MQYIYDLFMQLWTWLYTSLFFWGHGPQDIDEWLNL